MDAQIQPNVSHVVRGVGKDLLASQPVLELGTGSRTVAAHCVQTDWSVYQYSCIKTGVCVWMDGGCESAQDGTQHTHRLAWQGQMQSSDGD